MPTTATHFPAGEAERAALVTLHTRIVDTGAGFETMVANAEPAFRPVVERFAALHRDQAAAVAGLLNGAGDDVGGESLMATVNRTVVSLRSLFDDIDAETLTQIRSGEAHVIKAFDAAIAEAGGDRKGTLTRLRADLTRLIEDTRKIG